MMVRKIFFDMDGVLADFDRGIRELCGIPSLNQEAEDKAEDERMWAAVRDTDHFYDRLELMPGAEKMFRLNQICRESLFGAKQKNCLYFRDADAPPIVVPSYSVVTYFSVSEEQAEKEHIKRCIHPELPNNHYVYSEMHSLPDSLYESKDCYEGETIWKIPKDRIEEIARLLRLDKSDYPYMSALEMIDGDFFWIIAWDD